MTIWRRKEDRTHLEACPENILQKKRTPEGISDVQCGFIFWRYLGVFDSDLCGRAWAKLLTQRAGELRHLLHFWQQC